MESKSDLFTAKQFLDSMDTTVDPCDDFYQFSCGQFMRENSLDQQEKVTSVFSELETDLQMNLRRSILKINGSDEENPKFVRQLKDLFDKCMDTGITAVPSHT